MGLREFFRERAAPQAAHYGAMSFGGVTSGGYQITSFSPSVVEAIRLDGFGLSPAVIYRNQPAVRICVDFLALNIAPLNIKVFRRRADADREHLTDHPLARLLARPNAQTTRFDMIRGTVSDLATYDDAYWLKTREGRQVALHRIPPSLMHPKGGDILRGPEEYEMTTASGPQTFAPDRVVHFHGYNPLDTRIGVTRLEALRAVIAEENAASRHRVGFWKNAARADGFVLRPKEAKAWSDEARKRFREDWQNSHAGEANAGKTIVLEEGMDWKSDAFSPKDSEFIAGREWALEVVATAYQIPLAMLSRKQTATFASMKEYRKVLYVDVLGPWNAMLEGAIGLQLVPEFDDAEDLYVEFNIDEKLQGDFEQQAQAARQSVQVPWMSPNEMRAVRGLPRMDDPAFDEPARPANYIYPSGTRPAGNGQVGGGRAPALREET